MELRDYQKELIDRLFRAYSEGYKAPCIVLPCGGGKSVIVAAVAKRFTDEGKTVLFLVHRKELCEQIETTFSNFGVDMKLCRIVMVQTITDMIYSEKPEIVIIDFIQIVTSSRKFVDNRQRIDYISQLLKQAAKATGCCIITLSQLTRAGKDRPTMSDLKESGGLEQDSDYVILLYRPYVNDKSGSEADPKDTTVTLDKNKFGSTREFKYEFDGRKQRFTELSDSINEIKRPVCSSISADDDLPF